MTRSELIARLAEEYPHLRARDVEVVVATIFDRISATLAEGGRVELRGFGAFTTRRRAARTGRNPRTGEAVAVSGKGMPHFRPGKELRVRVNGGKDPGEGR
ncbi:integration host factor subunit beta [Sabulicella glaciei]|uniref:Integration host factor subunit beta n=1 Tax=Sabulicella glaciei TaxID=2984948 RepID=A0ABT3NZ66_9PROT|nr:integration host factor subunit beta [Roseococcus sp. MDT2-1-1]